MNEVTIIGLSGALALAALILILRLWANLGLKPLVEYRENFKDGRSTLIVLVHGTWGTAAYFACLHKIIGDIRPDSDVLDVIYRGGLLSNADAFLLSEQICGKIKEIDDEKHYNDIILVGYSKGALLIRKAFVYGHGRIEDLEIYAGQSRDPMRWVSRVRRLVLLAGMNRGWNLRSRPKHMPSYKYWLLKFGSQISRLIGVSRLTRRCESGEPFVANLRIQWLELMSAMPNEQKPTVIQLMGDIDDKVSIEDQRDVLVARESIWVPVYNTGHGDITDIFDPVLGRERYVKIKKALGSDTDIASLREASPGFPHKPHPDVKIVVVILHGIRDMAGWGQNFEVPLKDAYAAAGKDEKTVLVTWPSYGFFGMGPFLFWPDRQYNVRWFMDELTELKAKYPEIEQIHFIGHSNGTYVLASALRKYKSLKVGNIAFAGCVLRRDFDWNSVANQFERVRNYVAAGDWVVAWFPRFFEYKVLNRLNSDIGSAGFNGFTQQAGNQFETKYLRGRHGVGLDPRNVRSIVRFIVHDEKIDDETLKVESQSPWLVYSSKFCGIIWLAILVTLCLLAVGIYFAVGAIPWEFLQPYRFVVSLIIWSLLVWFGLRQL